MGMTDTEIHQRELLITIRYLFERTSEKHPASRLDICRFGNEYGMSYDDNSKTGNQMNRHRVGACLDFLFVMSKQYPDLLPFDVVKTSGGKFYAVNRNHITFDEANNLLTALKNSPFLLNSEKEYLLKKTTDFLFSEEERKKSVSTDGLSLPTPGSIKVQRLLNKACMEKKLIRLPDHIFHEERWFRVHSLKTFNRRRHAILIDVERGIPKCVPVEEIHLSTLDERKVLVADEEHRDLDSLLNKQYRMRFKSIDDWIEKSGYPGGVGYPQKISFRFFGPIGGERLVKGSFLAFFGKPLTLERETIQPRPGKSMSSIRSHATVKVSFTAFCQWMQSDPRLAFLICVTEPVAINERLAYHYAHLAGVYRRRIEDDLMGQGMRGVKAKE